MLQTCFVPKILIQLSFSEKNMRSLLFNRQPRECLSIHHSRAAKMTRRTEVSQLSPKGKAEPAQHGGETRGRSPSSKSTLAAEATAVFYLA